MQTLRVAECLHMADRLTNSDSARLDIELLLSALLQKNRTFLFTWPEHMLSAAQTQLFLAQLARREAGEPIAHIVQQREFWSLPFKVDASTLIPRPDTEILIDTLLQLIPASTAKRCLDLGTGTGAIALAIASEKPAWEIHAVDFSAAAVQLAQHNREALGFTQVRVYQSNWFSAIASPAEGAAGFDVIVSNPPYIDPEDAHLQQGDVRFEPRSALIADAAGMADLAHIIHTSPAYLTHGGWLLLEHGYDQADKVQALLARRGFVAVATYCDYGGNPRISVGQWSGAALEDALHE